jgi:chemotaxis signal transduction protein
MSPFGSAGQHVIVLYVGDTTYGLLVENVTGLRHVDDADLRPAPTGQQRELVCGSVTINGQLVLLANPSAVVMSS